jgi:hypothetical protein
MNARMPSLLDIVIHTPAWVWIAFALVLYIGYGRTRDRSVSLGRLLLLPAIMTVLVLSGLIGMGLAALPAILAGLIVGGAIGVLLERPGATRRLPDGKVWLRGEWTSLVQIALVFAFRYGTSVVAAVDRQLAANPTWQQGVAFGSALFAALFVGRAAARLRVYFTAPLVA